MAQVSRTFRIFVSSTFSDLKDERNALQERVFPELRKRCAERGARFQAIDLRWGVSEEAGLDQQTMNICLDEIERCQRVTPRPNFIVLLGDRYGWRPPPPQIPADEFEQILERVTAREDQELLEEWYWRDDNAIAPEYCLQPRKRGGAYEEYDEWAPIEARLHSTLLAAVEELPLESDTQLKYVASATEQEIAHGALAVPDARDHVFCFFRTIKGLPNEESVRDFVDLAESGKRDREARALLRALKGKLRDELSGHVHEYEAEWQGSGPSLDHLDDLCKDVEEELWGVIERQLGQLEAVESLAREVTEHERFGADRAAFFTGRVDVLERIADYVRGSDGHPLALYGVSGSGKSAVMARAGQQAREDHPDAEVVLRFIGATPESVDGRALLSGLCRQLSERYGADPGSVPTEFKELAEDFPKRLALATAERPLILFLDALDQLRPGDPARSLVWLPAELPEHARLIASALPGESLASLRRRLPEGGLVELEPMPADEGGELLDLWLEDARRTLSAPQRQEVLEKFEAEGLPLYLKLAFEEARRWKSYTPEAETRLTPRIPGIIRENLFKRLSSPANHGEVMVARSLSYLAAAKNGLSEDELIDVLSGDKKKGGVLADFRRRSPKSPKVDRLPVVVWSRLYFDLEPYLAEHSADGAALMAFYHRQLREAADEVYLAGDARRARHRELARYFADQELEVKADDRMTPNLRKMSELPYQQTLGEMWDEVFATLTDFHFLERKAAEAGVVETADAAGKVTRTYTGVFQLADDFSFALERMPGGEGGGAGAGRRPIIVTATDFGDGLVVRCPFCHESTPLDKDWLGQEIECPQAGCDGRLRVNPFVVERPKA